MRSLIRLKNVACVPKSLGLHANPQIGFALERIQDLQPAAALVLAAELDRWRRIKGIKLKPRALRKWNPEVLSFMKDLGLFDLLDIKDKHVAKMLSRLPDHSQGRVALQFVTDCTSQKKQTDQLSEELSAQIPAFNTVFGKAGDMKVSTALAEAALNSVNHAYPNKETMKYNVQDNRWWAAASYEGGGSTIRFFVYDQGVGISETLPNTSTGKRILGPFPEDVLSLMGSGDKIRALLETPKSRTLLQNRGKGFRQMVDAADFQNGRLRIVSGKGYVTYSKDTGVLPIKDKGLHLGGTLLEWTFELETV